MRSSSAAVAERKAAPQPMTVSEELLEIQEQNGGMVQPSHVIQYAANPLTALHSRFEWDDTKAAHAHRLWQARQIIRTEVMVVGADPSGRIIRFSDEKAEGGKIVRTYISLQRDRRSDGDAGYRGVIDVLSDAELRAEGLAEARRDMRTFRRKFEFLDELAKVFAAMDEVM